MPMHVFGYDNGIVDHDTGHKNQGKQRNAVERIIHEIVRKQGQGKCDRNREEHNQTTSPSHSQHHKKSNGNNGSNQVDQ
ncbi:hypothetical protein SDC9_105428 [bioreactor metagenome]|uniref:Uncharacterized protein n=1 Tax=bioreactor metagenome TaxID=1076179 RepID=A0A645AZK2_9ZZZZ